MIPFQERDSIGPPRLLSRKDLIRVILRLQFEGWEHALQTNAPLTPDRSEPYMNRCLFLGMVSVRNSLCLSNIFIVETPTVRAEDDPGACEGEPDVIMLFAEFGANEPHAILECKRLDPFEASRQLRGEYVRSGIDRFVGGHYGRGHDIDFMIAYVLRGTRAMAMEDVNLYLRNVRRRDSALRTNYELRSLGFVAESDHVRSVDQHRFRLLHSFVCFQ